MRVSDEVLAAFELERLLHRAAATRFDRVPAGFVCANADLPDVWEASRVQVEPDCPPPTLDELRALAEPLLGSWPRSGRAADKETPAPDLPSEGLTFHWLVTGDSLQATVVLLQPAPSQRESRDELPFALLAEIAVGPSRSRSNTRLRHEQGVTYGLRPDFIRARNFGMLLSWWRSKATRPGTRSTSCSRRWRSSSANPSRPLKSPMPNASC